MAGDGSEMSRFGDAESILSETDRNIFKSIANPDFVNWTEANRVNPAAPIPRRRRQGAGPRGGPPSTRPSAFDHLTINALSTPPHPALASQPSGATVPAAADAEEKMDEDPMGERSGGEVPYTESAIGSQGESSVDTGGAWPTGGMVAPQKSAQAEKIDEDVEKRSLLLKRSKLVASGIQFPRPLTMADPIDDIRCEVEYAQELYHNQGKRETMKMYLAIPAVAAVLLSQIGFHGKVDLMGDGESKPNLVATWKKTLEENPAAVDGMCRKFLGGGAGGEQNPFVVLGMAFGAAVVSTAMANSGEAIMASMMGSIMNRDPPPPPVPGSIPQVAWHAPQNASPQQPPPYYSQHPSHPNHPNHSSHPSQQPPFYTRQPYQQPPPYYPQQPYQPPPPPYQSQHLYHPQPPYHSPYPTHPGNSRPAHESPRSPGGQYPPSSRSPQWASSSAGQGGYPPYASPPYANSPQQRRNPIPRSNSLLSPQQHGSASPQDAPRNQPNTAVEEFAAPRMRTPVVRVAAPQVAPSPAPFSRVPSRAPVHPSPVTTPGPQRRPLRPLNPV